MYYKSSPFTAHFVAGPLHGQVRTIPKEGVAESLGQPHGFIRVAVSGEGSDRGYYAREREVAPGQFLYLWESIWPMVPGVGKGDPGPSAQEIE